MGRQPKRSIKRLRGFIANSSSADYIDRMMNGEGDDRPGSPGYPEEERMPNKRIYRITLPEDQDAEAFVTFVREQYFPAVDKSPTRVGAITDLVLLQRLEDDPEEAHEFLWHVGWSGLPGGREPSVNDEEVSRRYESFGASVEYLGYYLEYLEEEEWRGGSRTEDVRWTSRLKEPSKPK